MKRFYEVSVTVDIRLEVEAESEDQAEELGWEKAEKELSASSLDGDVSCASAFEIGGPFEALIPYADKPTRKRIIHLDANTEDEAKAELAERLTKLAGMIPEDATIRPHVVR